MKLFKCEICEKEFSKKKNMQNHISTWHAQYSAMDKFPKLKDHMTVNDQEKEFQCKTCGKKFKHLNYLRLHVKIHTGEKPYECKYCKKRFRQYGRCHSHERIHTGEKPFKCDSCDKRFNRADGLAGHRTRAKHTTEIKVESIST